MSSKKKVLALVIPASGHINLMCCLIKKLIELHNCHVILYSNQKYKSLVEKSEAEYRTFSSSQTSEELSENVGILDIAELIMNAAKKIMPELIKVCEEEMPDLILCDAATSYGRYLINYLKNKHQENKLNFKLPKFVIVHPSFAFVEKIYPASFRQMKMAIGDIKIRMIKTYANLYWSQRKINRLYGLSLPNEIRKVAKSFTDEDDLNICGVLEKIQPNAEKLIYKFKFIGSCISEEVRNFNITNAKLNEILNRYPQINPIYLSNSTNETFKKLIYISIGSVLNNKNIFDKIIASFKNFDQEPSETNSKIKFDNLEIIISVGKIVYEKFQQQIIHESYRLPENILILPIVPQLEILKRSSLFITHAGMNSVSETVHYGVPVICVPIIGDQHLVALRICDELNFGRRLNYKKFKSNQMRSCVHELLSNSKYLENILEFTKMSRNQNGCEIGANLIQQYLTHDYK